MSKKEYKDGISAEKLFMHSLYNEFIGLMVMTAKKYESDPDEVDDIIQDSLLKLAYWQPTLSLPLGIPL